MESQEKKKRQRPTVEQVRKLEALVISLEKRLDDNEGIINTQAAKIRLLEEVADNRANEVLRLKQRGFWARLFNR